MVTERITDNIRELTTAARDAAKERARAVVAGKRPELKTVTRIERYPASIIKMITRFCWAVLFAAFTPSAIRLLIAGYEAFLHGINVAILGVIVGICTVILAEISLIVCVLALSVTEQKFSKRILWFGAALSTLIALVGNYTIAKPETTNSIFAYLEALAPTVLALIMSYILKERKLDTVEEEHAAIAKYTVDEESWLDRYDKADLLNTNLQDYALALKEQITEFNKRFKNWKTYSPQLTEVDWQFLIQREIDAESWYTNLNKPKNAVPEPVNVDNVFPYEHKGIHLMNIIKQNDQTFVMECLEHGIQQGTYVSLGNAKIGAYQHCRHAHSFDPS